MWAVLALAYDVWNRWMHARGSAKMVMRGGVDYLERRYLLALGRLRVFLHRFWLNDPDPLHDHPWAWGRLILRGRYREHYIDGTFADCGPGHLVLYRDARVFHRVELLTPTCTTIFWHWGRYRHWGFMMPEGWRPTPAESSDARPMRGVIFPRKAGPPPTEVRL